MLGFHPTKVPKAHTCLTCGRHFGRIENLVRHERSHNGKPPFQCLYPKCGKIYGTRANLRSHQLGVHGEGTPREDVASQGTRQQATPSQGDAILLNTLDGHRHPQFAIQAGMAALPGDSGTDALKKLMSRNRNHGLLDTGMLPEGGSSNQVGRDGKVVPGGFPRAITDHAPHHVAFLHGSSSFCRCKDCFTPCFPGSEFQRGPLMDTHASARLVNYKKNDNDGSSSGSSNSKNHDNGATVAP